MWKISEGRSFAPIVELEEGEAILAVVVELREHTGQFDTPMLDLVTLDGTPFSLNGHAILADKVREQYDEAHPFLLIKREGMNGRAINYEVQFWTSTEKKLRADAEAEQLIGDTQMLIDEKLAALPPRD